MTNNPIFCADEKTTVANADGKGLESFDTHDPLPRPVFPLPDYEMEPLRSELLRTIEKGLSAENIESRRRRPGLRVVLDGKIIHVWLGYYLDQRWWRITCGWGSDHPAFTQCINKFAELTCCIEEIDDQTGVHLARLLRDPEGY